MGAYNLAMLSLILPTLNAGDTLGATLKSTEAPELIGQTILSDGGSTDGTQDIAAHHSATFLQAPKGRGSQLAKGAEAASHPWLLFLHADTRLGPGWQEEVRNFIKDTKNTDKAAVFKFALDDANPAARRLEKIVARRGQWFGLPYGDQGLLISRAHYDQIGGYKGLPLYEDVDIMRRIGRQNISYLETPALTSAARYQKDGYILRPLRNVACLSLYFAGVSPNLIRRLYQ